MDLLRTLGTRSPPDTRDRCCSCCRPGPRGSGGRQGRQAGVRRQAGDRRQAGGHRQADGHRQAAAGKEKRPTPERPQKPPAEEQYMYDVSAMENAESAFFLL